jgi:hypothetical protein
MKLFRRQNSAPPVTNEQLADSYAVPDGNRIDWKRAVPRVLALVLILALIVWGVVWAIGNSREDKASPKAENQNKIAQTNDQESGYAETASTSKPAGPNQTASSTAAKTAQTNQQLTNSGPGETAALFVITTAAGVTLYQIKLRRQRSLS